MDHLYFILLLSTTPLLGFFVHNLVRRLPHFLTIKWQITLPKMASLHTGWFYTLSFGCTLAIGSTQNNLLHGLLLISAASLVISLAFIDWCYQWLPDCLTLPLLWSGLAVNLSALFAPLQDAVLGAMLGYLLLWSVNQLYQLVRREPGIGQGDFKLLAALGAWGGWSLLPLILLLTTSLALLFSLPLYVRQAHWLRTRVPFGSYLAISGWAVLIWHTSLP